MNTTLPGMPINSENFLPPAMCTFKKGSDEFVASQNAKRERITCSLGIDIHLELDLPSNEGGLEETRRQGFNPLRSGPACGYNYQGKFPPEEKFRELYDDPVKLGEVIESTEPYDPPLYKIRDPRLVTKTQIIRDFGCKVPIDLANTQQLAEAVLNYYPDTYVTFLNQFVSNLFGESMKQFLAVQMDGYRKMLDNPAELNRISWGAYIAVRGKEDGLLQPGSSQQDCTLQMQPVVQEELNKLALNGTGMTSNVNARDVYDLRPCIEQHIETLRTMHDDWCQGYATKEMYALVMMYYANEQGRRLCWDRRLLSKQDTPDYDEIRLHVPATLHTDGPPDLVNDGETEPDRMSTIHRTLSVTEKTCEQIETFAYAVGRWSGSEDTSNVFLNSANQAPFMWGWGHPCNLMQHIRSSYLGNAYDAAAMTCIMTNTLDATEQRGSLTNFASERDALGGRVDRYDPGNGCASGYGTGDQIRHILAPYIAYSVGQNHPYGTFQAECMAAINCTTQVAMAAPGVPLQDSEYLVYLNTSHMKVSRMYVSKWKSLWRETNDPTGDVAAVAAGVPGAALPDGGYSHPTREQLVPAGHKEQKRSLRSSLLAPRPDVPRGEGLMHYRGSVDDPEYRAVTFINSQSLNPLNPLSNYQNQTVIGNDNNPSTSVWKPKDTPTLSGDDVICYDADGVQIFDKQYFCCGKAHDPFLVGGPCFEDGDKGYVMSAKRMDLYKVNDLVENPVAGKLLVTALTLLLDGAAPYIGQINPKDPASLARLTAKYNSRLALNANTNTITNNLAVGGGAGFNIHGQGSVTCTNLQTIVQDAVAFFEATQGAAVTNRFVTLKTLMNTLQLKDVHIPFRIIAKGLHSPQTRTGDSLNDPFSSFQSLLLSNNVHDYLITTNPISDPNSTIPVDMHLGVNAMSIEDKLGMKLVSFRKSVQYSLGPQSAYVICRDPLGTVRPWSDFVEEWDRRKKEGEVEGEWHLNIEKYIDYLELRTKLITQCCTQVLVLFHTYNHLGGDFTIDDVRTIITANAGGAHAPFAGVNMPVGTNLALQAGQHSRGALQEFRVKMNLGGGNWGWSGPRSKFEDAVVNRVFTILYPHIIRPRSPWAGRINDMRDPDAAITDLDRQLADVFVMLNDNIVMSDRLLRMIHTGVAEWISSNRPGAVVPTPNINGAIMRAYFAPCRNHDPDAPNHPYLGQGCCPAGERNPAVANHWRNVLTLFSRWVNDRADSDDCTLLPENGVVHGGRHIATPVISHRMNGSLDESTFLNTCPTFPKLTVAQVLKYELVQFKCSGVSNSPRRSEMFLKYMHGTFLRRFKKFTEGSDTEKDTAIRREIRAACYELPLIAMSGDAAADCTEVDRACYTTTFHPNSRYEIGVGDTIKSLIHGRKVVCALLSNKADDFSAELTMELYSIMGLNVDPTMMYFSSLKEWANMYKSDKALTNLSEADPLFATADQMWVTNPAQARLFPTFNADPYTPATGVLPVVFDPAMHVNDNCVVPAALGAPPNGGLRNIVVEAINNTFAAETWPDFAGFVPAALFAGPPIGVPYHQTAPPPTEAGQRVQGSSDTLCDNMINHLWGSTTDPMGVFVRVTSLTSFFAQFDASKKRGEFRGAHDNIGYEQPYRLAALANVITQGVGQARPNLLGPAPIVPGPGPVGAALARGADREITGPAPDIHQIRSIQRQGIAEIDGTEWRVANPNPQIDRNQMSFIPFKSNIPAADVASIRDKFDGYYNAAAVSHIHAADGIKARRYDFTNIPVAGRLQGDSIHISCRAQLFAMLDAAAILWSKRCFFNPADSHRPSFSEEGDSGDMHPWCQILVESFLASREKFKYERKDEFWEHVIRTEPEQALSSKKFIGALCDDSFRKLFPLIPQDHKIRDCLRKVRSLNIMWGMLPSYGVPIQTSSVVSKQGAWMPLSEAHRVRLLKSVGLFDQKNQVPSNPWIPRNGDGLSTVFNQSYHSVYPVDSLESEHFREWVKDVCRYQPPNKSSEFCNYPFSQYGGTPVEADFLWHKVEAPDTSDDYIVKRHAQLVHNRFGFTKPMRLGQQFHDSGFLQDMYNFKYRSHIKLTNEQKAIPEAKEIYPSNFMAYARNHAILALSSCNHGTSQVSEARVVRNLYRMFVDAYEVCEGVPSTDDHVPVIMGFLPNFVTSKTDRPIILFAGSLPCINAKLEKFCVSSANAGERICQAYKQTYLNDAALLFTRLVRADRRRGLHRRNYRRAAARRGASFTPLRFFQELVDIQDAYIEFLQTTLLSMALESDVDMQSLPLHLLEPREVEVPVHEEDTDVVGNDFLGPRTLDILRDLKIDGDNLSRTQLAILSLMPPNHRILGTLQLNQKTEILDLEHVRKQIQRQAIEGNKKVWSNHLQKVIRASLGSRFLEQNGPIDFSLDETAFKDPLVESANIQRYVTTTNRQMQSSLTQNQAAYNMRKDKGPKGIVQMNIKEYNDVLQAVRERVERDYEKARGGKSRAQCLAELPRVPEHIKNDLRQEYQQRIIY